MTTDTETDHQDRESIIHELQQSIDEVQRMGTMLVSQILEPVGLSKIQFHALEAIDRLGPDVPVGEVGASIGAPPSSMTGLANHLVKLGLIERTTPPGNRRSVVLKVTDQGQAVVHRLRQNLDDRFAAFLDGLTVAELRIMADGFGLLKAGIGRQMGADISSEAGMIDCIWTASQNPLDRL